MVRPNDNAVIRYRGAHLSHADADQLARLAQSAKSAQRVCLCLSAADDASTAALARLVLLRRSMLAQGRDVFLLGLRGRTRALYEVSRLFRVLPSLPPEQETELLPGAGVGECRENGRATSTVDEPVTSNPDEHCVSGSAACETNAHQEEDMLASRYHKLDTRILTILGVLAFLLISRVLID